MATATAGLARFRIILWALVVVAAVAATALFLFRPPPARGLPRQHNTRF